MKKILRILLLFALLSTSSGFAEEAPDFFLRGILDLDQNRAFSLTNESGESSGWIKIGQSFNGYKLTEFDSEARTLTLVNGDAQIELSMAGASASSNAEGTPAERLAEAERMMNMMNFEQMINDTLDGQMEAMSSMMAQQMAKLGQNDEELLKFQSKLMREMFDEIDWKPIQAGMTQAYAEVFTKDELSGMTNFYTTPAGQATITKMPEIQQKTMQVMMPAIMESSQKMQTKMIEYMQNKRAAETEATE